MVLRDRKLLARLMAIKGVSQRELAKAADWKAHSYVGRLLDGQAKNVDPIPAARIALHLEVPMDKLFLPRASSVAARSAKQRTAA